MIEKEKTNLAIFYSVAGFLGLATQMQHLEYTHFQFPVDSINA